MEILPVLRSPEIRTWFHILPMDGVRKQQNNWKVEGGHVNAIKNVLGEEPLHPRTVSRVGGEASAGAVELHPGLTNETVMAGVVAS